MTRPESPEEIAKRLSRDEAHNLARREGLHQRTHPHGGVCMLANATEAGLVTLLAYERLRRPE